MNRTLLPKALLALFLLVWVSLGLSLVFRAPYASGTDESIRYVALAAAKNRWATESDFGRYQIDHFYYAPLYYLLFAPWYGDNPVFVERYPSPPQEDQNYLYGSGGAMNSRDFLDRVPPDLLRLYRAAKLVSLALGTAVLLCLAASLAAMFDGPQRWWLVLAGTIPAVFLPQFLYYHTLCNNDPLVNALGAAAILSFTLALGCGRRQVSGRRFHALSLLTGALVGLALLTKMSGAVLLPLLPALALAAHLRNAGVPLSSRIRRSFGTLLLAGSAAFFAGGWWVLRQGLMGDWSGTRAHRLAHPWAFKDVVSVDAGEIARNLYIVARTYVGLFTGTLYGIPDWVFVGYLLVPLGVGVAALWGCWPPAFRRGAGGPGRGLRLSLWSTMAVLAAVNIVVVMVNALFTFAAHGRLLFPTLVASHALFAALVGLLAARRPAWVAPVVLFLAVSLGTLFGWTFRNRMLEAVTQPRETIVQLAVPRWPPVDDVFHPPVWPFTIEHQLLLPPGRIRSFRVGVRQPAMQLSIGGALDGSLRLYPQGAPPRVLPLGRTGLGDDLATRWPEIGLEEPLELRESTPAMLELRGTPPWLPASRRKIGFPFASIKYHVGQFAFNKQVYPASLSLSAVYETSAGR